MGFFFILQKFVPTRRVLSFKFLSINPFHFIHTCIIQFRNLKFEKEVRGMSWRKQCHTWFSKTAKKICSSSSPPSPYFEQNPGLKARIHKCNSREKDCLLPQKKLKRRLKNAQLQRCRRLRPLP